MTRTILSGSWCGPCQMLKQRLKDQNIDIPILDIDDTEGRELVTKYKVRSIPTLLEVEEDKHFLYVGPDDILERLTKNV